LSSSTDRLQIDETERARRSLDFERSRSWSGEKLELCEERAVVLYRRSTFASMADSSDSGGEGGGAVVCGRGGGRGRGGSGQFGGGGTKSVVEREDANLIDLGCIFRAGRWSADIERDKATPGRREESTDRFGDEGIEELP